MATYYDCHSTRSMIQVVTMGPGCMQAALSLVSKFAAAVNEAVRRREAAAQVRGDN